MLPYSEQQYYWPDSINGPFYGISDIGYETSEVIRSHSLKYSSTAAEGTPEFPFAATGLMQYAKPFQYSFNGSHNATLYERCTSTFADPTRGTLLDGLYGRASSNVLIAQPRLQKPGWDGCRDRFDNRSDLPSGLQYVQPLPRYGHRAVYHAPTSEILFYGGMAYLEEQPATLKDTWQSEVKADMWYYNLFHCVNNCSFNGDCNYGFCSCHVGYYGVDCSNTSCPGTFCYYNEFTHEQNCTHACQAGYVHTDADVYIGDVYKIPCTENNWGTSHGICDGFGSVQCAPPYIGSDCGTKDCKSNCSFNGWCSIEYPVSRCMCQPGYFGEICDMKLCLNNCSYPNGFCNTTTGVCACNQIYSPFNNTRAYELWGGEDCSYNFPYAGAGQNAFIASLRQIFSYNLSAMFWWLNLLIIIVVLSTTSLTTTQTTTELHFYYKG